MSRPTRTKRQRTALFIAATAVAAGLGVLASCSFPEVTFAPNDEGGNGEASTTDVSEDVRVLIDGGDPDALIVKDAGQKIDPTSCEAGDCDCDKDQVRDTKKPGCTVEAGVDAGPHDCDDTDSRVHPGQGPLVEKAAPPQNGDWNCSGKVEKFYEPNVKCTSLPAGSGCDAKFGFEDDPACGERGTYVTCKTVADLGVLQKCVVGGKSLNETQACK